MSADGIATEMNLDLDELAREVKSAAQELLAAARLEKGDIFVVGCSSSEIAHHRIGTFSNEEIGKTVVAALHEVLDPAGVYLAAQCCEHLNRAIIIEKRCAREYRLPIVNVVPQLKAGGSFATAAYRACESPVAVERIQAQAGMDIGDTLIGMHLQPVAVPYRTKTQYAGDAHIVCARTRPKYIGGERAHYDDTLK